MFIDGDNHMSGFGENFFTKIRKKVNKTDLNPRNWRLGAPRITLTLPVKRGYSFWPFIIIPRSVHGADREATIAHEQVHFKRQQPWKASSIGWLPRYIADKDFRWREEKRGLEAQIRKLQELRRVIDYEEFINKVYAQYHNMASLEEIRNFFYNLRDTNPYSGGLL